MADKNCYPQIPTTVWWGVRAILNKTPNVTIDERLLGIQLGVQEVAARQYIVELKLAGILGDENKATPLALQWRLDSGYHDAVQELVENVYPQSLRDIAPPGDGDRQKAVSWFLHEGLGQGAAGNKAATYLMISGKVPNEAPSRAAATRGLKDDVGKNLSSPVDAPKDSSQRRAKSPRLATRRQPNLGSDNFPLNVNVQIHISADAGSEQIESIFSAMRRYLYDNQSH